MADRAIRFERFDQVAVITLNRPEARNAINEAMMAGLSKAIHNLEEDSSLRVGILQANVGDTQKPVFCAGADLKSVNAPAAGRRSEPVDGRFSGFETAEGGFAGFTSYNRSKPVIGAVDGLATAGGLEIVLACDIIIASSRSSFALPEVRRNLLAAGGGLWRLPRAVGRSVATEMILTGEPLSVDRAYQLGLVNHVVAPEQLQPTAMRIAQAVCASAPLAVRESMRVLGAAHAEDDERLAATTRASIREVVFSADTAEGVRAFLEKRPPVWRGR